MTDLQRGEFSPLTKSVEIDQALLLAELAWQHSEVDAFKQAAVQKLPQASRETRQAVANRITRYFMETQDGEIQRTPALRIWASSAVAQPIKRALLYVYYMRAVPLAWHAVNEVILPRSGRRRDAEREISQAVWDDFLGRYLRPSKRGTFNKTRSHLTAHLTKFGLLEREGVPGDRIAKRYFANPVQPPVEVFWFALALEYADNGWTSRGVDFLVESSWSRVAFCIPETFVRWALHEAEVVGLGYSDYYGSEQQFTWRPADVPAALAARLIGE